jgi:hypothetical protein
MCLFCLFRHVQVNNEGAIAFYKKFGFEVVDLKQNYYKRIEPADAYVLQKNLKITSDGTTTEKIQQNGTMNGTSSSIDSN